MSAIAGVVHFDGEPGARGLAETMAASMAHRGPDRRGLWSGAGIALAHNMLQATTEALAERQPLACERGGRVLVMDGRVDNRADLQRALVAAGCRVRDRSDAELVLRAFETWGAACVERLEGDFALAVWDDTSRELFCARDRMGHKPFFYSARGARFAFASELQALLGLSWVSQAVNDGMLAEHLAAEWHSREDTLWRDVSRLPAAHRLRVRAGSMRADRYWRPDLEAELDCRSDDEFAERYRALLDDSVARASRCHRPLAIEVSGGLDSSAVLGVAEALRRQGRLLAPGIVAGTMTFDDAAADELAFARATAAHLGVELHEVPGSLFSEGFFAKRARDYRDSPGFPNAWLRSGMLDRFASQGCRVALTGEGGDAWLDGTRAYYAEEIAHRRWAEVARCFRADARAFGNVQAFKWLVRHGLAGSVPEALRGRWPLRPKPPPAESAYWLTEEMRATLRARRAVAREPLPRSVPAGRRLLLGILEDAFTAHVLESIERVASLSGIELRHPLQDSRLVQMAFCMPERLRLRGDRTKYLHVHALRGLLPPAVLARRTKADFSGLLVGQLLALRRGIEESLPAARPAWVTSDGVARLFEDLLRDSRVWPMWPLWSLWCCDRALVTPVAQGSGKMAVGAGSGSHSPGEDAMAMHATEKTGGATGATPAADATRRPYSKPVLQIYGSVSKLTKGTGGSKADAGNMTKATSDRAYKERIVRIGEHPLGIGIYLFEYKTEHRDRWGHGRQFGVMADEVEAVAPHAVSRDTEGNVVVDYALLGICRASG